MSSASSRHSEPDGWVYTEEPVRDPSRGKPSYLKRKPPPRIYAIRNTISALAFVVSFFWAAGHVNG